MESKGLRSRSSAGERPDLLVRYDDLPSTARDLAAIIARSGRVFDRAGPVKVIKASDGSLPEVRPMTPDSVVNEAHGLARPVKTGSHLYPVTLPHRVGRLYRASDDWGLQPLKGIMMAPPLSADGTIRHGQGYDTKTGMWCCQVPAIALPAAPNRADAHAALQTLRAAFRTFPFADATTLREPDVPVALVDASGPPGQDESAFLVALLTAVCRPCYLLRRASYLVRRRSPELAAARVS
jgi:hypothetical protein